MTVYPEIKSGPHGIYSNERTVCDSKGDFVYLDIEGNLTSMPEDVFQVDLAPDEEIIKEFDILLKPQRQRKKFFYWLKVIFSLGLYLIWIKCCGCCRKFILHVTSNVKCSILKKVLKKFITRKVEWF